MQSQDRSAITFAVVIPTSDRPRELARALASVFAQTELPDEVIVADDASSPPVTEAIFAAAPPGPRYRLVSNPAPLGANAARNRAIAAATADYIAFLDDDDEFMPEKLATLRAHAARSRPDVLHHAAHIHYDRQAVGYDTRVAPDVTFEQLLSANVVGGTSLACVRRDRLIALGGFDPALPALQDWDLWLRAARAGARFAAIDRVLTLYHFVTGRRAISKSIAGLAEALAAIDAKHRDRIAALTPDQRRRRARTDAARYAHRYAMNGRRLASARAYAGGAIRGRSPGQAAAALLALLGIRYLALMRKHVDR